MKEEKSNGGGSYRESTVERWREEMAGRTNNEFIDAKYANIIYVRRK